MIIQLIVEIDLGTACKDKTQCKDGNAICNVSCTCSEAFYRDTTTCNARKYFYSTFENEIKIINKKYVIHVAFVVITDEYQCIQVDI